MHERELQNRMELDAQEELHKNTTADKKTPPPQNNTEFPHSDWGTYQTQTHMVENPEFVNAAFAARQQEVQSQIDGVHCTHGER